jgi:UDPglucose 6-dehydrogenase
MRVAVCGLWHLGTVIAACLAAAGHDVVGWDDDVEKLREGTPPLFEPGLEELIRRGLDSGRLRFSDEASSVRDAEVVWMAWDTPVDEDDRADIEFVMQRIAARFGSLKDGALVVVSSQLPVGSVRRLEAEYAARRRTERVSFACSPENLRLGNAIEAFMKPHRVIAGARTDAGRETFTALMEPVTESIEWMSVESAEMTKHALNAFLATSVAFANEIAVVCERVGADAKEVERGLKSEPRIGPRAYLSPGAAFAGGTLARDVSFLTGLGAGHGCELPLLTGVKSSNDRHKLWARTKLRDALGALSGKTVAVWGLTYKAGTDTLRRSMSVELCRWLVDEKAKVRAWDPVVKTLPRELQPLIQLASSAGDAVSNAAALVVGTEWPEFRSFAESLPGGLVVIDPNRFLDAYVASRTDLRYYSVGRSTL